MWGSIIGDLAGSIYEYAQTKEVKRINIDKVISDKAFFSDDTILTVAIIDAIMHNYQYDNYLRDYIYMYNDYKPDTDEYFKTTFSPSLLKWASHKENGISIGNGALMRISPIGYLFDNELDIVENTYNATIPSHHSTSAIDNALIITLITFLARKGYTKEKIIRELNLDIKYNDFKKFNTTCDETINNCLYALFTTNNFVDSIKTVISYGGDTDTNACIVGGMAEAMYGIDEYLIDITKKKIPTEFTRIINNGYSRVKKLK